MAETGEEMHQDALDQVELEFRLAREYSLELLEEAAASAERMTQANIERFPELQEMGVGTGTEAAASLNAFMSQQFKSMMDDLYPGWKEDLVGAGIRGQKTAIELADRFKSNIVPEVSKRLDFLSLEALNVTSAQLAGEVPDAVSDRLGEYASSVSEAIGRRQRDVSRLSARDLGVTTADLQASGRAGFKAALNVAPAGYGAMVQGVQMPVATGVDATNLISQYRTPLANAAALTANAVGIGAGVGFVSPATAYTTASQVGYGSTQTALQSFYSHNDMISQNMWAQRNYDIQMQAIREADKGGGWGGAISGAISGAAAGSSFGWVGGVVGAVAGGIAGYR